MQATEQLTENEWTYISEEEAIRQLDRAEDDLREARALVEQARVAVEQGDLRAAVAIGGKIGRQWGVNLGTAYAFPGLDRDLFRKLEEEACQREAEAEDEGPIDAGDF